MTTVNRRSFLTRSLVGASGMPLKPGLAMIKRPFSTQRPTTLALTSQVQSMLF